MRNRFGFLFCITVSVALIAWPTYAAENSKPPILIEPITQNPPNVDGWAQKNNKKPDELLIIGAVAELPIYAFYLGAPNVNGKAYVPNFATRVGPRLAWKKFGLRATFSLPIPDKEIKRRGESEQSNFLFSFYWKKYAVDFYYQHFRGFYIASPLTEFDTHKPDRYPQLPDAEVRHYGFNLYYNTDPAKFSFSSAFDQTDDEIISGDTWVIIPFYRHWRIGLGNRIIQGSNPNDVETMPKLPAGHFDTLGTSLGYTRMWMHDNFFASALGGLGPAAQLQTLDGRTGNDTKFALAGKFNLNLTAGFKRKDYIFGSQILLDSLYSRVDGTEIYSTLASLEFFLNKRL